MKIEDLTEKNLRKTFKRLKKDTKRFSKLIVRDPVDYIDFEVGLSNNLKHLIHLIRTNSYIPSKPYFHNMPKSKGINRPTVVLDIFDMIMYRFCIEQIEDDLLSKTRQKHIRGGIKITANKKADGDDFYEKWFDDWKEHNNNLRESLERKEYLVSTDIASYFENINILMLKDSIRSDVTGKNNLLNLLFYFLEHTKYRYEYEVNTFNGLLQEDTDASRLLAYYFLRHHDQAMAEFCQANNAEYYRFVDDMSITVDNGTEGRKALKVLTESLRRLNLVAGIEKTEIIPSEQAYRELFFEGNDRLTILQDELIAKTKSGEDIKGIKSEIISYYKKIKRDGSKRKNWIKILKRFYTLCSYGGFDLFRREIDKQIIQYPLLFSDTRIFKYVLRQKPKVINNILNTFINYLYSEENLYPQLETNLLELFLGIPVSKPGTVTIERLKRISSDIFWGKNDYMALSDYAKALASLLIFKFGNKKEIDKMGHFYLKNKLDDAFLQKYVVLVSLCNDNHNVRNRIINKAKKELNPSLQRVVNMIENANEMLKRQLVKKYINKTELIIYQNKGFKISEEYDHVRGRLLKQILTIYA
jgi:hypothetical protein